MSTDVSHRAERTDEPADAYDRPGPNRRDVWLAVARADFDDAVRSKMVLAMIGILVGFAAVLYTAFGLVADDGTAGETLAWLALPMQTILAIAALVVGYVAIVGERRSGRIRMLCGLPPTRRDVLVGKLLARGAIVVVAVVPAFVLSAVLSVAFFGTLPVGSWLVLGVSTTLFGLAFVGLAVGVSAAVSTRGRAMAIVVGWFATFVALWELVVAGPYYLLEGESPPIDAEKWYLAVDSLNPISAYAAIANEAVAGDVWPLQFGYGLREPEALTMSAAQRYPGEAPFYLQEWFGLVILTAWFAIPLVIGYARFRRMDL